MYCFNGLFIYVDIGYPGKFHDVNILRSSELFKQWRNFFTHDDDYFEYLLGDPGYVDEDMFIIRRIGQREIADENDDLTLQSFKQTEHSP